MLPLRHLLPQSISVRIVVFACELDTKAQWVVKLTQNGKMAKWHCVKGFCVKGFSTTGHLSPFSNVTKSAWLAKF